MSIPSVLHRMPWSNDPKKDPQVLLSREWLVTNGLGGFASGTISGACTRRFHGLLISALPAPLGRTVMLNHLSEEAKFEDGRALRLDTEERPDGICDSHTRCLSEFRLEAGLPVWEFALGEHRLEKRVMLPYLQNTVHVTYRLLSGPGRMRLRLRPSVHFRPHEGPVSANFAEPYTVSTLGQRCEIMSAGAPPLRLKTAARKSCLVLDGGHFRTIQYRIERARGYDYEGRLWSPGYFRIDLEVGEEATLTASTEAWETVTASDPAAALAAELERREHLLHQADPAVSSGTGAELVLAADQFIIQPITRLADVARAHAAGDDARTVIAGYHWFTDWGRDTMISLEGLTLTTGRHREAGYMLRTFARYVRDGLIPNLFPEGEKEGLYHTADATLWFFQALHRYVQATNDTETLHALLPTLHSVVEHHVRGTHFGIRIDPADGLFTQGQEGYQLTWMDAKVGDWVVTPRRGKAVELNALWYHALRLLERWSHDAGDHVAAADLANRAQQCRESFNRRFWFEKGGYLYDIVDGENGDDDALRPNQLFAVSLDYPVLDASRWQAVVDISAEKLLTPVGLRSLAPGHPDYKPTYDGDLRARDAAYHQGTVWGWLIGPFIDAWLRVHPHDKAQARQFLAGFTPHLGEACIGSISEVFDAEAPYYPRGCIAQAWSVAEVLRCLAKTAEG